MLVLLGYVLGLAAVVLLTITVGCLLYIVNSHEKRLSKVEHESSPRSGL